MTQKLPAGFDCEECRRIARALRAAWRADNRALRARLRDVAESSGRDTRRLGMDWIFSVASMPDEEMKALMESHYPHVAEARQQRDEHETVSGHSVWLHGLWAMSLYGVDDSE